MPRIIKKRIKNIYIRIDKYGEPFITMPYYASESDALRFYEENKARVDKMIERRKSSVKGDFLAANEIWVLGKNKKLKINVGLNAGVHETDDEFIITATNGCDAEIRRLTENYLKNKLNEILTSYLDKWQSATSLRSSGFSIRKTKTRWGSCNCSTGKLNFSLFLANVPPRCISYVVLHEVCHLKYANHGAGFKRMLSEYMSDWADRKKELNDVYVGKRFE